MGDLRLFVVLNSGERLDKFLAEHIEDLSRSRLQDLIHEGMVRINGNVLLKSGMILSAGQKIEVEIPAVRPSNLVPEEIPLKIIFENDDLMVVNKPAGMVVHPSAGHFSGTLVHAALAHSPTMHGIGGEQRPGVVHRLDKDTSGLILMAKNDRSHNWLLEQFKLRKVKKVYLALVDSKPPTPRGRIEAPIGRDPSVRKKMAIVQINKGREAITEYLVLESYLRHTLLEAYPYTGRTHQIRLHLAFIGCPIVADTLYGRKHASLPLSRHFLHAHRLSVVLPGEQAPRIFEAEIPEDLRKILSMLRGNNVDNES